jgi:outer membrane protein assembly factor BamB
MLAGSALYVGSGVVNSFAGALAALDPLTGARLWRTRLVSDVSGLAFYQNPDGAAILIAATSAPENVPGGAVYGVRASDGAILWHIQSDYSAILGEPTLGGATVYVNTPHSIYALNAVSGHIRWRVSRNNPNNIPFTGALTLINGVLYIGSPDGSVVARRASEGAVLWRYSVAGESWQTVADTGDMLYTSDNAGTITAVRVASRSVLWRGSLGHICAGPLPSAIILYVCGSFIPNDSQFEALTAVDAATGGSLWRKQPFTIGEHRTLTGEIPYQAATLAGTLYVVSVQYHGGFPVVPDGALSALDPYIGSERWSISGGYGGPSLPAAVA